MGNKSFLKGHPTLLLLFLRSADSLILLLCGYISFIIYMGEQTLPTHYQVAMIITWLSSIVVFQAYDIYRPWRGTNRSTELGSLLLAWVSIFSLLIFLAFVTKTSHQYSRVWLFSWMLSGGACLLSFRFLLRSALYYFRSKGFNQRHIIIIGSGQVAQKTFEHLNQAREAGFVIHGFFSDNADIFDTKRQNITIGSIAQAHEFATKINCDQVWIAMPLSESNAIEDITSQFANSCADIRLVPDIFGLNLINQSVTVVADLPVVNLSVSPMTGVNQCLKAIEDKSLSLLILLMISPALLLIAIGVKLSSPGPVIYRQHRISWNGETFNMYKFRSMPIDIERNSGAVWAKNNEQRATTFGAFLRRSSLDELPQFLNVLKGDMSIVGPRPERPIFVEQFKDEIPGYMQKHKVKAGITGWAQIHGWRGDTCLKERIEHDLYYINSWSIWLDLKIIFLTLLKGFASKNAY